MNQDSIDIIKANQNIEAYQKRIFELEAKLKEAENKLNDCRKTAGSDTDCDPLVAVQELRSDYQSALEEIQSLESQLAEAKKELDQYSDVLYEGRRLPDATLMQDPAFLAFSLANSWEKRTKKELLELIENEENCDYDELATALVQFLDKKKENKDE